MPVYALGEFEPSIDPSAFVHPDAVIIGRVTIGAEASVWPCAVIRGDYGAISVGAQTSIQDGSVLHATAELDTHVGARCVIGHLVHLEGCVIEDDAMVGNGSVVLHRAVVRRWALVGSNAVVPNGLEVPSYAMALGVPAKIRPDCVKEIMITDPRDQYLRNVKRYPTALRRLG